MTQPPAVPTGPSHPVRPGPRRRGCVAAPLLVAIALGAVWYFVVLQPRLHFTNRLVAPVRLVVGAGAPRTVAPGATVRVRIPRGRTLVAEWEMVRPLSADSQPMGEVVKGALVVREVRGTVRGEAGPRTADADFFAPLISNGGDEVIRLVANAGLQGARDCGCAVRPGATRVFVGYYRLYQNSTVLARGVATGREAFFRELGPRVTRSDGAVGLRFEARDLRPPAPPRPSR
ncbi:MAG TPA: hypothetical protein VJQ44_00930 [Gemmatimonadales bacterium]|nr:hypothetical protein [Gemmatimonadales bacterium]